MKKLIIGGTLLIAGVVGAYFINQPVKPVQMHPASTASISSQTPVTINTSENPVKTTDVQPVSSPKITQPGNITSQPPNKTVQTVSLSTKPKTTGSISPLPSPTPQPPHDPSCHATTCSSSTPVTLVSCTPEIKTDCWFKTN